MENKDLQEILKAGKIEGTNIPPKIGGASTDTTLVPDANTLVQAGSSEQPKHNKTKIIFIGILLLVFLIAFTVYYVFVFSKQNKPDVVIKEPGIFKTTLETSQSTQTSQSSSSIFFNNINSNLEDINKQVKSIEIDSNIDTELNLKTKSLDLEKKPN